MYSPTAEDREAIEILSKRDDLTEWEEGLLEGLDAIHIWTEKQHETLDKLFARKMK